MRRVAYAIVAYAHEAMSHSKADIEARGDMDNPRRQIHLLLETLKNGIPSVHARLPSLMTMFLLDAISVLSRPGHFMYPLVNAFLLSRAAIDVTDVPMFYTLFYSGTPATWKAERNWLLHVVSTLDT
jgi:hypothetical protein